jgi:DtxR family Mn-dependent transcriptional regulator
MSKAADGSAEYTASVEDYVKAIYHLSAPTGGAVPSDVAARLGVARPSVTVMVRRLAEQRLVEFEPYGAVHLSAAGRTVALRLIRRHRVIEAYLVAALGYTWDQVHDEAERLEHAASDVLIDRMASAIGAPTVDPHGAPIPPSSGAFVEPAYRALGDLAPGEEARVARVKDEDPALLRHLAALQLVPGADVRCVGREPFNGPLTLEVGASTHVIGAELAGRVLVEAGPAG